MARFSSLVTILVLVCIAGAARAQHGDHHGGQGASDSKRDVERFEGYVLDKHCAKGEGDALSDAGKTHKRACLIKAQCGRSGYGLVVDGKWYAFDRRGSAQAARLIRTANYAEHEKWDVEGTKKDDVISVTMLEVKFALR